MNQSTIPFPASSMNPRIRLVLVDDEPNVLRGLTRGFISLGADLDISTCGNAAECLELLKHRTVDVVVTDLHMPGMNGALLLEEIRNHYPTVLRFVLSGEAKPEIFLHASNHALKCMSKPCEASALLDVIRAAILDISRIKSPEVAQFMSRLSSLPSSRAIQMEIVSILSDPNADLEKASNAIRRDPSMVARILKVSNSTFFGHSGSVETLDDAISLLGMDSVACMVATHKLFASAVPPSVSRLSVEALWEHSARTAGLARLLGPRLKMPASLSREGVTAALLHDVGKIILACAIPEHFAAACTRASADQIPEWQAEYPIFGNHHAEVGAALLHLWGLPEAVVDGVAHHHTPHHVGKGASLPAILVHIADAVAHLKDKAGAPPVFIDFTLLTSLGLPGSLDKLIALLPDLP